ncbi:MAG: hydantoinase B/oxoprolinase family protein [Phototrophicaceae bacterium]
MAINPIVLEVLWNRLLSVANEQQVALMRTAFSTVVRESQDLACGVFDTRGYMIAQSLTGTPGHINPMATGAKHFLKAYPPETLKPGDVLVTNDPWLTAGQINDLTVMTPVFRGDQIVGYFANCCHSPDIGGRILSAEAQEVYEEGLRIPIMKLFIEGEPNHELLKLVRANVRTPDETVGDLYAQTASNAVGARSLLQMMDEFKLDSIDPLADEIITRSEAAMRDAIRRLPNGAYEHEVWSDGFEEPLCLKVKLTIHDEDIEIDFDGSSPQNRRGINVVMNYTRGYASFAMKAAISPEVPHNEGAFRPVHVTAPEGSILNCKEPAAVASRHLVGHFLPSLVLGALSQAMPNQLIAGSADPIWMSVWRGRWQETNKPATFTMFQVGGTGARATKDGLNTTGFPSGVAGVPAEVVETVFPIIQQQREFRTNSGGVGQFRGGLGQATRYSYRGLGDWSLSAMVDRTHFSAQGLAEGQPGALGEFKVDGEISPTKRVLWFDPASLVDLNTPGGGGYGEALARDPQAVLRDVIYGYISIESALHDYGVVIHYVGDELSLVRMPQHYQLDEIATTQLRAERKA